MKIEDIDGAIQEVDLTVAGYRDDEGRLVGIEDINDQYLCQGCGGSDITVQATCLFCNACRFRTTKESDATDEFFKAVIIAGNKDEYSLRVPKMLIMKSRFICNEISADSPYLVHGKGNLDIVSPVQVHFTYDRATGIIHDIKPIDAR